MGKLQRFGIDIGPGWVVLFLIAGALLLGAYWIGPLRPLPAQLELLAIDGATAVRQVDVQPRTMADGSIVFPVPVAVRNVGARTARPAGVVLSAPPQFRVATPRGWITGEVSAGVPLRRFAVGLAGSVIEPDSQTLVLPGLDTIYLAPDLPRYYCTTQGLQIPEFSSAPKYDARTLSEVRLLYSFRDAAHAGRQTGLITLRIDPTLLEMEPAANPPSFETVIEMPVARAPETGTLLFAGARTAYCGDPEQPVELYTTLWETMAGGHVYVVYIDNVGRKRLYDLNGDGIIELETWDADGDGRFEARRQARFAVPEFLQPIPPRDPQMTEPDPVPPDSEWLALFHSAGQGPSRFARSSLVAHPQVAIADTAAADTTVAAVDTTGLATADPAAPRPAPTAEDIDLSDVRPATPQFLALFTDTTAGPFRFSDRPRPPVTPAQPRPQMPTTTPTPTPTVPAAPDTTEVTEPEPEPEPEPAPPPRRRQPLGTPIVPPR